MSEQDPGSPRQTPFQPTPSSPSLSRRRLLGATAQGFGALAAAGLMGESAFGSLLNGGLPRPHHAPRARSVIFLYMDGGVSQVDSFDPKPRLEREHGQPIGMDVPDTQFDNVGTVLASPWTFRPRGQSGLPVSDLFPRIAEHADELCVVRSMTSKFPEHTAANYFLHTGHGLEGRPSMGAWVTYGLGSLAEDLPGYCVVHGGLVPPGGLATLGSGFLPAAHQGSVLRPEGQALANVEPASARARQEAQLELARQLDRGLLERAAATDGKGRAADLIETAIENAELAFRMQAAVPELTDLDGESERTLEAYGFQSDHAPTRRYASQCLLARRLVERGVRFIELTMPHCGHDRWDQHSNLEKGHGDNARTIDQPVSALLTDLRQRGLLDETLVLWAGEFGRTPMAQGSNGRDHNPHGFSIWMAGGGVRGGHAHGGTDEYGYYAVDRPLEMYDLHATILHLLGFDHTRLTVRFSGRDMRLTDVHGRVIHDLLA